MSPVTVVSGPRRGAGIVGVPAHLRQVALVEQRILGWRDVLY